MTAKPRDPDGTRQLVNARLSRAAMRRLDEIGPSRTEAIEKAVLAYGTGTPGQDDGPLVGMDAAHRERWDTWLHAWVDRLGRPELVVDRLTERVPAPPPEGRTQAPPKIAAVRDVEPAFKGARSTAEAQRVEKAAHEATMAELERVRIAGAARDTEDMAELMQRRGMPVPPPKAVDLGSEDPDEPDLDDLEDDEGPPP
jgi:hypothetical protein